MPRRDRSPAAVARAFLVTQQQQGAKVGCPCAGCVETVAALVRAVRRECAEIAREAQYRGNLASDAIRALNHAPKREVRRGR